MIALLFPGQGSQAVGMGKDLAETWPAAREVFAEVDDALGESLSCLMFDGDEKVLTLTENTQPALLACSVAAVRALEVEAGLTKITALAGHSIGEYAALVTANSLSLADAARLVRLRGLEMQRAVPQGKGAMVAVLGLDVKEVETLADEAANDEQICAIANDNCPGQVVMSGDRDAVLRAVELAKERGARRAIELSVSAPFHCALMAPAARAMATALAQVDVRVPSTPVYANVTAAPLVGEADTIKDLLVKQITAPVRWREILLAMAGARGYIEAGEGRVLSGLVKRVDKEATVFSLARPDGVREAAAWLSDA